MTSLPILRRSVSPTYNKTLKKHEEKSNDESL